MSKYIFIVTLLLTVLFIGCNDEKPVQQIAGSKISVGHKVNGAALVKDTIVYKNAAGNSYSISRVEYYLSGFTFQNTKGEKYVSDSVFLVNAFNPVNEFQFIGIPVGDYTNLSFYIGVEPTKNLSGALPPTIENLNMAWPDQMGGGYHFLKYEGHFLKSDTIKGFALHLGLNPYLIKVEFDKVFTVTNATRLDIDLEMDLNKWFDSPNVYDLTTSKVYTMGDAEAMGKISENGKNVISIKQIK